MSSDDAVYTHGHHASVLRSHNNRTVDNSAAYLAAELEPGLDLLDVGSGPGTITADFAERLAPGRVMALEVSKAVVDLTRAEIDKRGLTNVDYEIGDIHDLAFADDSFDIVHAHQVLQHVGNPVRALREMRRVCKPGGIVAVCDSDYAGFVWYPQLPALDDWMALYQQAARANGGEPNAGRYLLAWARQAGFADITPTASAWCLATPDKRAWWGNMWAQRIVESRIAGQLLEQRIATRHDLARISRAWQEWAAAEDGWMSLLRSELLCRV